MPTKLRLPLRDIRVNQPFGVNFVDFYTILNLKGHNGVDFKTKTGCACYSAHDGVVIFSGKGSDEGVGVEIWDTVQNIKTIYWHLESSCVKKGSVVKAGQLIGRCDNTGFYTTGDHLHFGLKRVDRNGNTININNGFKGAIDPTPYFCENYEGNKIKNKDCYKSNSYHRYFRKDRNIKLEAKFWALIPTLLRKVPTSELVNAIVYGAWDRDIVKNDAMFEIWGTLKKGEFLNKKIPFLN